MKYINISYPTRIDISHEVRLSTSLSQLGNLHLHFSDLLSQQYKPILAIFASALPGREHRNIDCSLQASEDRRALSHFEIWWMNVTAVKV